MMLIECDKLRLATTWKAWDLAVGDYGHSEISEDTNIAKLAAECELDAMLFAGCDEYFVDEGTTRHDQDDVNVYEIIFYKDGEEYNRVPETIWDNDSNTDWLKRLIENDGTLNTISAKERFAREK